MRLAQENIGDILSIDVVKGLACGKALDLEDARSILKINYRIEGSDDISKIKDSDIIVVTAGLARKPGMTREELLAKNSQILKDICLNIKKLAPESIVIIVTNPLDLMTYFALKILGFIPNKVIGMGLSLDAARFANIISKELNIPNTDIEACVIGSHGEGMLPMPRFSTIKGVSLEEFLDEKKLGKQTTAFVHVSIKYPKYFPGFVLKIKEIPEVLECHRITGNHSCLLKVKVEDSQALDFLLNEKIGAIEGVTNTTTEIALSTIKEETKLNLALR